MTARILAIEDSDQNLMLMELCLAGEDLELLRASSPAEALEMTARERLDLVLLDLEIPEMDGCELCRRICADPRSSSLPVIALLAEEEDEERRALALQAGVLDCWSKPLNKEDLGSRIQAILRMRGAQKELEDENRKLSTLLQESRDTQTELQEALAEAEGLLACHSGDSRVHLLVDSSGTVVAVDGEIEDLLGLDPLGCSLAELPEALAGLADLHGEGGRLPDLEGLGVEGNRLVEARLSFLGRGRRLLSLQDVTERRRRERRLQDRKIYSHPPAPKSSSGEEYRISGLIGSGSSMLQVSALADKMRNLSTPVLIQGETGTGKELVARALHFDGRFANTPFIPIHCGAISPELIESELFGYEKGAFTGATTRKDGLFTAANQGTVFLDEVSETSMELQVKLLRVLQLGEIRPVGATQAQTVNVRILAATNRDLRGMLQNGEFREDLFYRLEGVTIRLPALRERPEDIPSLAEHIIRAVCQRQGREGHPRGFSKGAMNLLRSYSWPGNVRELENVIEAAISLGCGELIQERDLLPRIREGGSSHGSQDFNHEPKAMLTASQSGENSLASRSKMVERSAILEALSRFDGDKRRAAAFLRMSRSTFYRKLKAHGVG
ncbi:MAG: sigma 54-interacting transcriptional regulator [Planctomycetota bacterium]|jgi:DNA-binding NtrC family response regulator